MILVFEKSKQLDEWEFQISRYYKEMNDEEKIKKIYELIKKEEEKSSFRIEYRFVEILFKKED
jgi:NAD-dependent DNA ligase